MEFEIRVMRERERGRTMSGESILLVDDDRQLLDSMSAWLRELGFVVTGVPTLTAARRCLVGDTFDLVLADIRLGDEDGIDLLEAVRQGQPETPTILMTGYATVETGIEA